jgi:CubicO group peptidase (beta-lactamase class C family)
LLLTLSSLLIAIYAACSTTSQSKTISIVEEIEIEILTVVASDNSPSSQEAVVDGGKISWLQAYDDNTSVDHVYMNASVQKGFTATAVLQLMERGHIDLDADVSSFVPFDVRHPDFPDNPITVRLLLAHRSGLGEFPHQFRWNTESSFSPEYRPPCPSNLLSLSTEKFLIASLTPKGTNYTEQS